MPVAADRRRTVVHRRAAAGRITGWPRAGLSSCVYRLAHLRLHRGVTLAAVAAIIVLN